MTSITYPISRKENGITLVVIPKSIYSPEAIRQTAYKYSGNFNIIIQENGSNYDIIFEAKNEEEISDEKVKEICNDFIDQQIRIDTERQFGHIRDLIVEEAFKPVSK